MSNNPIDKLNSEAKSHLEQTIEELRKNRDLGMAKLEAKEQLEQGKPNVKQEVGQLQTPAMTPTHAIPSKEGHRPPARGLNPNSPSSVSNPSLSASSPKQANPLAASPSVLQNQQGLQQQANPLAIKPSEIQKEQQQPEKSKEQDRGRE